MRILVVSAEVWSNNTNGGNVLSNIFSGTGYEFAQIYCNPGKPFNHLCKNYYQMTDSMMVKSILGKGKPGQIIKYADFPAEGKSAQQNQPERERRELYDFFRNHRLEVFYIFRSLIWKRGKWDTPELRNFMLQFQPDLIFAPCYASHELLAIDRFAKAVCNVPVISYISDDNYGMRQFRLSPVYWLNRLILRKNMRKTFKTYDLVYTMTDEQKEEYEDALKCKMKVLKKSGNFADVPIKEYVNRPIRLIYAGGIYCGRWKTLAKIVDSLRKINTNSLKMILDIYTGNNLTDKQRYLLDDGRNCFVHASISQDELKKQYRNSDIALHVESFDLKYKLLTRLSFSTKIIDCLESGCATMAICWKQHSGYIYLRENDIAICVDSLDSIYEVLMDCVRKPKIIIDYANRARLFGKENHQREKILKEFMADLEYYALNK